MLLSLDTCQYHLHWFDILARTVKLIGVRNQHLTLVVLDETVAVQEARSMKIPGATNTKNNDLVD